MIYQPPASFAFFCRGCKQIWATVEVEVEYPHWRVEIRNCPKHGIGYMLYYEIAEEEVWRKFDYSILENPPIEIALRELELIGENLNLARYPGGYEQQIVMGV